MTAIGAPLKRREDPKLLVGEAKYVDDIQVPGQLWMGMVRSPMAHAKIASIDTSEAEHPDFEREVAIVRAKAPAVPERLARQTAMATGIVRELGMYKPPGVAETLDWANAMHLLGETELTEETVDATLGTLLKYREDQDKVRREGLKHLLAAVASA